MTWSQFGLVRRRVCSSLRERVWAHILTSGTMATALFVFGGFMLMQENLQKLLKGWGDQIQINAYLDNGLNAADVSSLSNRIKALAEVEQVRYVSQEQAWADFRSALGAQANVLEGLPADVLPASFEISVKPAYRDALLVESLANRLRQEKGIDTVEYAQEWVERLSLVVLAVQWTKWVLGGILFGAAFVIVGSTVRLAILARKDEIEIMQLVGASEELIQAPFVIEGMIQGIVGASLAILFLWSLLWLIRNQIPTSAGLFGTLGGLQFIDHAGVALILGIGWLLGASGSLFSLRRFMKTWRG
jgi:cell division transport system permease protein